MTRLGGASFITIILLGTFHHMAYSQVEVIYSRTNKDHDHGFLRSYSVLYPLNYRVQCRITNLQVSKEIGFHGAIRQTHKSDRHITNLKRSQLSLALVQALTLER